jgi:hypothetical protein
LTGCAEFARSLRLSRREFIQAGMLGNMGIGLGDVLRKAAAAGPSADTRANNVILLWMRGGPSHIDMWDPKPEAPVEYRGEFGTIDTRVPGIQLTDMLPRCAGIMEDWSIVRSLYHQDAGHSTGDQICFTGYPSGPNGDESIPAVAPSSRSNWGGTTPRFPPRC